MENLISTLTDAALAASNISREDLAKIDECLADFRPDWMESDLAAAQADGDTHTLRYLDPRYEVDEDGLIVGDFS